ncbi:MAG TPA: ABC transporter permease [Holosporales bacterium]|nr:ABC transporter permease [Holosporales bacterium]
MRLRCLIALTTLMVLWPQNQATAQERSQSATKPHFIIAMSQIVEHPSLDAARQGILDALTAYGFVDGENISILYKNAQGNITTSSQIAQNLAANNPKPAVFVTIGTPTAQGAISATRGKDIPIVFTAVTDPVSSRLVKDLKTPSKSVTGVIDYPPLKAQIDLMKTLLPDLKVIGVLYNPGESNSVSVIRALKEKAEKEGISIIEAPVAKAVDLALAVRKLVGKGVQALYVPQDNTVISAMPQLASLSYVHKTPVFTSDNGSVKEGAFASISYSYYTVGQKTGEYIKRILEGESIENLPITTPSTHQLYINTTAATALGLEIPKNLLKTAVLYPEIHKKSPQMKEALS